MIAMAVWGGFAPAAGAATTQASNTDSGTTTTTSPPPVVATRRHAHPKSRHHAHLTSPPVQLSAPAPAPAATADTGSALIGVFAITAGSCSGGTATGTYFRMIEPGGTLSGPFLSNSNSACANESYTLLSPGTARGLSTAAYQPNPSPSFDSHGNGRANSITQPQEFFGVDFSLSTNSTDPQTGLGVSAPSISNSGGTLSGNVEAISVGWNDQNFNQGSPKPGGTKPGLTSGPTGTYNAASGAFTLNWSSLIVGGPFNSFTGLWHLQGTFISSTPAPTTTTTTPSGSHTSTSTASTTGVTAASGAPDASSGDPSRALANTGIDTEKLLLLTLVMFASGAGLLLIPRPTRKAHSRKSRSP